MKRYGHVKRKSAERKIIQTLERGSTRKKMAGKVKKVLILMNSENK